MPVELPLKYAPVEESLHVYLNGVEQYRSLDWKLRGSTVVLFGEISEQSDLLEARYIWMPDDLLTERTTLTALEWEPTITMVKAQRVNTDPAPDEYETVDGTNATPDVFTWVRMQLGPPFRSGGPTSQYKIRVTLLDPLPSAVGGVYDTWVLRGLLRFYNTPNGETPNATEGGFYMGPGPHQPGAFIDYNLSISGDITNMGMVWARHDNEYGHTALDPVSSWNMDPLEWDFSNVGPLHGIVARDGTPFYDGLERTFPSLGNRIGFQGWTSVSQYPEHLGTTWHHNGETSGSYSFGGSDSNFYRVQIGQRLGTTIVGGEYKVTTANRGYPAGIFYRFGRTPLPRTTDDNGKGFNPLYLSYQPLEEPAPRVYLNGVLLAPTQYTLNRVRGIVSLKGPGNIGDVLSCTYDHNFVPAKGLGLLQ